MPAAASKLALVANRIELPWDPTLHPGPAALPFDRNTPLAVRGVAPPIAAVPPAEVPAVGTPAAAPAVAAPPTEAVLEAVTPESTEPRSEAAMSTRPEPVDAAPRAAASFSESRSSPSPADAREPGLTAEEIERRKQRYEQWLESEGLERIH
jgi:hypothetical protein